MSQSNVYKKVYALKEEVDVGLTMRDGVRLSSRVYRPDSDQRFPVLLAVSPYQHDTDALPHSSQFLWHEVGPYAWYVEAQGYVIVHVDVRGTGRSEGRYGFLDKAEQQDLYEIVEWCSRQPWSNGRVGGYGQSYYCWSQWFMAVANPPGLACIAPYDGSVDLYREAAYHGGILCDFFFWWFQMVRVNNMQRIAGAPPGQMLGEDINRAITEHETCDDWWRERSAWERLSGIAVPTLSVGHWGKMGLHLRGNIVGYEEIKAPKKLVVTGARDVFEAHHLFDDIDFHEKVLLPFYDHFLKGIDNGAMDGPRVKLFVRGVDRYREEKDWPLARAEYRSLYLSPTRSNSVTSLNDGSLSWSEPVGAAQPTPHDYPHPNWKFGVVGMGPQGPDVVGSVLTFTSEAFPEDIEVTGPAVLKMFISSSNVDTDVFVKVSDQLPQPEDERKRGLQPRFIPISKGWLRASHRKRDEARSTATRPIYTHENPEPLVPGEIVELDIEVLPFSNVFKKGHRIRLEISNGDSGITDPFFTHQYSWWKVGRDLIYHDRQHASRLILPIIPGESA